MAKDPFLLHMLYKSPTFGALQKCSILEELGHGVQGKVFSCLYQDKPVAIKCILKSKIPVSDWTRDRALGSVTKEIFILKRLEHKGIIGFVDKLEDEDYLYLVMEKHGCQHSVEPTLIDVVPPNVVLKPMKRKSSFDLFEYITTHPEFPESKIKYIFRQIVEAVLYLHQNNIAHNDIKDENV